MASVRRLQPVVEERVNTLVGRFREFKDVKGDEGVMKIDYAFTAFANGKLSRRSRTFSKLELLKTCR